MVDFKYVTYNLTVTSSVRYLDGHHEPGPSTQVGGRFDTVAAGRQVLKIIQDTVGSLHHNSFGRRLRSQVRQVIVPVNDDDHAYVKIEITYRAQLTGTAFMKDGSTQDLSEEKEFTMPI